MPLLLPFHVFSQIYEANRLLARRHFDLIIFRLDILPIAPFVITRQHKTPHALKTLGQGMINVLGEKLGGLGKILEDINLWFVRKLLTGTILADSVSTAQVEFLKKILKGNTEKIVWIDNAVNTSRFYPVNTLQARNELGLARFEPIIGYVGTRP